MLNQGLLEGNPSFSFLYLVSGGRPLAGNGRTARTSFDQHDRRPVDGSMSTGRHWYRAWGKGEKQREKGRDGG